jgi:hypothetical protein
MKDINIVYFIWINPKKNYKAIISGQLDDLIKSKILDRSNLHIEVCCEHKELQDGLDNLIKTLLNGYNFNIAYYEENLYEYYGIKKLYELACNEPKKCYLYFHSKGMFNYDNIDRHPYEKTLTKGTIYQYEKVISIFNGNPKIMKIGLFPSNIHKGHFIWLNFYWARGSYLRTCEPPIISTENRYYYETWSESGNNNMGDVYNLYENNYKKYILNEVGDILNKLNGKFIFTPITNTNTKKNYTKQP